ncbi:hypothetical protein ACFWSJ_36890 [Streptomyces niveus]
MTNTTTTQIRDATAAFRRFAQLLDDARRRALYWIAQAPRRRGRL